MSLQRLKLCDKRKGTNLMLKKEIKCFWSDSRAQTNFDSKLPQIDNKNLMV